MIACKSDSEIILVAAFQTMTVETVVRTQRHRLDADKLPMFSVDFGPGKGFVAIWIPVGLSSGLLP